MYLTIIISDYIVPYKVMKYTFKHLIIIILLFITGNLKAQPIEVKVEENIELMSILSRMAGFPEYSMDLAGQYILDMDSYFEAHRSHPMVMYMKKLREKHGVSYDAVMDMAIRLEQKDGKFQLIQEEKDNLMDERWNKVNKEEFLTRLNGFYQDTDFHTFFTNHAPLYQQGIQAYKDKVMAGLNHEWYSKFYGKEAKEKFGVIIGFCNGGGNYGIDLHPSGQTKEVYAIVGYYVDKANIPQYNADYLPTLIHEFNHSFINYLLDIEENRQAMEDTGKALMSTCRWAMSKQAYSNWKTVINESLVRASVICYMLDAKYNKEVIQAEMNEQLQRNFRWMPELVRTLRIYENNRTTYPTFESFYPQIIQFFKYYVEKEQKETDVATY